jgi:hypothetical protein
MTEPGDIIECRSTRVATSVGPVTTQASRRQGRIRRPQPVGGTVIALAYLIGLLGIALAYLIGLLGIALPLPGRIASVDLGLIGTLVLLHGPAATTASAAVAFRLLQPWIPASRRHLSDLAALDAHGRPSPRGHRRLLPRRGSTARTKADRHVISRLLRILADGCRPRGGPGILLERRGVQRATTDPVKRGTAR